MKIMNQPLHYAIIDFVKIAQTNGISNITAALPRTHELVISNQVRQIRKIKDVLAVGFDELNNKIVLTVDCKVLQLD
jgi:hypothetical protein